MGKATRAYQCGRLLIKYERKKIQKYTACAWADVLFVRSVCCPWFSCYRFLNGEFFYGDVCQFVGFRPSTRPTMGWFMEQCRRRLSSWLNRFFRFQATPGNEIKKRFNHEEGKKIIPDYGTGFNSTRLFFKRPSGVSFVAAGMSLPKPFAVSLSLAIPCFTR